MSIAETLGVHPCVIDDARITSSSGGSERVELTLGFPDGSTIRWYGYLTDAAHEFTLDALDRACGRHLADSDWDLAAYCASMCGSQTQVSLKSDTWEGKTRMVAGWLGESRASSLDVAHVQAIGNRLRALSARPKKPDTEAPF